MKKAVLYSLLLIFLAFSLFVIYTISNPTSPLETVSTENQDISITYSRPYKKNRLIFGDEKDGALVPNGVYWRTGANKHTFIETEKTLIFNSDSLSPENILFTPYQIPNLGTFILIKKFII